MPLEERADRVVHPLVARQIEVLGAQEVRDANDRVAVDQQRPEDPAFRRSIVWLREGRSGEGHGVQHSLAVGCAGSPVAHKLIRQVLHTGRLSDLPRAARLR